MRQPRKLSDLAGYKLKAWDGDIGRLEEIFFDDRRWVVRYFVVRTGSWLLGRKVLIVPSVVTAVDDEQECLEVDLTREQIENAPPIDTALPVSLHYEREYYRYYGWEPYWTGDPLFGPSVPDMPPLAEGEEPAAPEDPHLRSSDEVNGYNLRARDGEIGHVDDFILEEPDWSVRYLLVDTGRWLMHNYTLIAPAWIREVDWSTSEVVIDLARDAIETAPPYDPDKVVSREYQVALYAHYGKKAVEH